MFESLVVVSTMSNPSSPGSPSKIFIDIDSSFDEDSGSLSELKEALDREKYGRSHSVLLSFTSAANLPYLSPIPSLPFL